MWSMFKVIAQSIDQSLDRVLEPAVGRDYGRAMGTIGAVLLGSLLVIVFAIGLGWKGREIHQPTYYLVSGGKPVGKLPVLNSPNLSAQKITDWSNRALRKLFTFDFRNIEDVMSDGSVYFSPGAYSDFKASMEKTKMVNKVKTERLKVVLTGLRDAQLVGRGVIGGRMALVVEQPVVLTYIGGEKPVYQYQFIQLLIRAVPTTENPEGLSIVSLKASGYHE